MPRKKHIQIHIPEPCQQPWSAMRPDGNGRFCENCQKTVVDFSGMSDAEIVRIMTSSNPPSCGRLLATQVDRPILVPAKSIHWPRWATGLAMLALAMPHALLSQSLTNIRFVAPDTKPMGSSTMVPSGPSEQGEPPAGTESQAFFKMQGRVTNVISGRPYVGAEVKVFPFLTSTKTDSTGWFELDIDLQKLPDNFDLHIVFRGWDDDKEVPMQKNDIPAFVSIAVQDELPRTMGGMPIVDMLKTNEVPRRDIVPKKQR